MNICETTTTPAVDFAAKLAYKLFAVVPEHSPLIVITDDSGNHHASNDAIFADVFSSDESLKQVCERIADGQDPISAEINGYNIFSTQLDIDVAGGVYALIAVPQLMAVADVDMAELIFAQTELIAEMMQNCHRANLTASIVGDLHSAYICN